MKKNTVTFLILLKPVQTNVLILYLYDLSIKL